jgi:hypothetical protein
MSHLSKIKTKLTNQNILEKTLDDLNINWENSYDKKIRKQNIKIWNNSHSLKYTAELVWQNSCYELIADSETWTEKKLIDAVLEKVQQKYAYNTIFEESTSKGFSKVENCRMEDGSLRLVLEKWMP